MNTVRPAANGGGLAPRSSPADIATDGKFLRVDRERFLIKGVTYGTFAPDQSGCQYPSADRVAADFRQMAALGINTVRTYTVPPVWLLDEAARCGLRVMVGIAWSQHVAFLDHPGLRHAIRREVVAQVNALKDHPAILLFALGNEIPPGIVRWHGRARIERFLRRLYTDAKAAAPHCLFTYVNFPPTEFLDLSFFDVCAFNVYLHRADDLRAYLARLQHVAGDKPLLLAEAGADSVREGEQGQGTITARHVRVAFEEGACGAIAFAWTDEWWRGGHEIHDWAFGLVDRDRQEKPAAAAVAAAFRAAPFSAEARRTWPRVSVVVCAYNAADTIDDCLSALARVDYPDYEVLVVNDGSRDATGEIARRHPHARVIDVPNGGLSAARNIGLARASGEIVAYTDADVRVDRDWLTYLVQPFLTSDVVGAGGPSVVPADDPPMAQCVARAPGAPTHVLLDDRTAEHVPGCNMAFRRNALLAIGGFNPIYLRAGDDVDVCWRLQARGWRLGFAASALVWHHHRATVRAYWRQQVGYGEGEAWLRSHHPEKFLDGKARWQGRIYSALPSVRSLAGTRVNSGVWGTASFPSVYQMTSGWAAYLPQSIAWQLTACAMVLAGLVLWLRGGEAPAAGLAATGLIAIASTLAIDVAYAWKTRLDGLSFAHRGRLWYRRTIFGLHLVQPLARAYGGVRGWLSPAEIALPHPADHPDPSVTWRDVLRALQLMTRAGVDDRHWSEHVTTSDRVLADFTDQLRRSRGIRLIVTDDGWCEDRDVSVFIGRWARLDVRALLEDHGAGRGLLRIGLRLRPTLIGATAVLGVIGGASVMTFLSALTVKTGTTGWLGWPLAAGLFTVAALAVRRLAIAAGAVRASLDRVVAATGMMRLPAEDVVLATTTAEQESADAQA